MHSQSFMTSAHGCTSTFVFNKILFTKCIYCRSIVDGKHANILVIFPPGLEVDHKKKIVLNTYIFWYTRNLCRYFKNVPDCLLRLSRWRYAPRKLHL